MILGLSSLLTVLLYQVPPDAVEPLFKQIVNQFVHDRSRPEVCLAAALLWFYCESVNRLFPLTLFACSRPFLLDKRKGESRTVLASSSGGRKHGNDQNHVLARHEASFLYRQEGYGNVNLLMKASRWCSLLSGLNLLIMVLKPGAKIGATYCWSSQ
jgi:hypothetical protein